MAKVNVPGFVIFALQTRCSFMERVMGIEPTSSAWKAEVLPLNYTRETVEPAQPAAAVHRCSPAPGRGPCMDWWRGEDSNLRRLSQQIYSLPPLTAREPLREQPAIVAPIPVEVNAQAQRRMREMEPAEGFEPTTC